MKLCHSPASIGRSFLAEFQSPFSSHQFDNKRLETFRPTPLEQLPQGTITYRLNSSPVSNGPLDF
jgi:hypothetical protein